MANNSSSSVGGIGFVGLLTIVFITLKLTHVINWSWWWVLSPLWISAALVVGILAIIGIVLLIIDGTQRRHDAKRRAQIKARLDKIRSGK